MRCVILLSSKLSDIPKNAVKMDSVKSTETKINKEYQKTRRKKKYCATYPISIIVYYNAQQYYLPIQLNSRNCFSYAKNNATKLPQRKN